MSQNNQNFKDLGGSTDAQTNNEIENLLNMSQNEIEKIKEHNNILYRRSGSNPVGASTVSGGVMPILHHEASKTSTFQYTNKSHGTSMATSLGRSKHFQLSKQEKTKKKEVEAANEILLKKMVKIVNVSHTNYSLNHSVFSSLAQEPI
jgi:RNA 3'-terminal phosphate cyclase